MIDPAKFATALRVTDPRPLRYRSLDDYEADLREGIPCKRAIMPLARGFDGEGVIVNPEWLNAPYELGMVFMDTVMELKA